MKLEWYWINKNTGEEVFVIAEEFEEASNMMFGGLDGYDYHDWEFDRSEDSVED